MYIGGRIILKCIFVKILTRDSRVGIAAGYGLDGRGNGVKFLAGASDFFLSVQHPDQF
jgi:hypothetical protein